jgi:hypothetical protein
MAVGEDHGTEIGRRKIKGVMVALLVLVASLYEAAVDQYLFRAATNEAAGTGHHIGRAMKTD